MGAIEEAYRIVTVAEHSTIAVNTFFLGSILDQRDGFIHLSVASEAKQTAARYYKGAGKLYCLKIDLNFLAKRPGVSIRLETVASRNNAIFPHVYFDDGVLAIPEEAISEQTVLLEVGVNTGEYTGWPF